jgi:hypothetical protein
MSVIATGPEAKEAAQNPSDITASAKEIFFIPIP